MIRSSQRQILRRPVTLEMDESSYVKIEGFNGSGKSTLLRIVAGFHKYYSGEYMLNGMNASRMSPNRIREIGVAYMPQHSFLFRSLTVREFVRLLAGRGINNYAYDWLLETLSRAGPGVVLRDLAGGVQQLLGLLAVMSIPAQLYLLDEPFRQLDSSIRGRIVEYFGQFSKLHSSGLVIVDHLHLLDEQLPWRKVLLEGKLDGEE